MSKAKVQSEPMLCILCPGDGSRDMVLSALEEYNIDVVESHRLDDGFTLLVVGVAELPRSVVYRIDGYSWHASHNRRGIELFLAETKRGTPSNRIFNTWK
jgi:hypothetical protein